MPNRRCICQNADPRSPIPPGGDGCERDSRGFQPGVESHLEEIRGGLMAVVRQREGTTAPPVAWDRVRGASSVDVAMMAAGGGLVKSGVGGGWVATVAVLRGWVSGGAGSCRRRGRVRRRTTGAGRWRTGRVGRRP